MKKQYLKTIGSTLIVAAYLFIAFGSGDSKSKNDISNSTKSEERHTCSECGKTYEGDGYTASSDGVGGPLSLDRGSIFTECKECAQKSMDRMNEARRHKGYQGHSGY